MRLFRIITGCTAFTCIPFAISDVLDMLFLRLSHFVAPSRALRVYDLTSAFFSSTPVNAAHAQAPSAMKLAEIISDF